MSAKVVAVTGATGFLGGRVVDRLAAQGHRVRALVRGNSDVARLRDLQVELCSGDLNDPPSLDVFCRGADVVFHCAALVSDWGPWARFERGTVQTTRHLVDACERVSIPRLVHVSSVAAYGHPRSSDGMITEEDPLGANLWLWDYYARAKMDAETQVNRLGTRAVIVRPTWIYGPRDRSIMPRLMDALRRNKLRLIGKGDTKLNLVHVNDIAAGVMLAGEMPAAAGEVFNLCSNGDITQRELFDIIADVLDEPRVRRRVPSRIAYLFGFGSEITGKLLRRAQRPTVTRHSISLISRPARFSSEKARTQLAWQPEVDIREGLKETISSLLANQDVANESQLSAS